MCTSRLFSQTVDLFALNFYLDRVVSINRSWYQKTRDTGLSEGKDRIPLRSLVLTILECDGQTDGRICSSMYSACKASFGESCKN